MSQWWRLMLATAIVVTGITTLFFVNGPSRAQQLQVPYAAAIRTNGGGTITAEDSKRIIFLLENIDRNIEQLLAPKAEGAPRNAKLAIAVKSCAMCHTPSVAVAKGGGFVFFADERASAFKPLSTREAARVKEAVQSGFMPPEGFTALTPAEKAAFAFP